MGGHGKSEKTNPITRKYDIYCGLEVLYTAAAGDSRWGMEVSVDLEIYEIGFILKCCDLCLQRRQARRPVLPGAVTEISERVGQAFWPVFLADKDHSTLK